MFWFEILSLLFKGSSEASAIFANLYAKSRGEACQLNRLNTNNYGRNISNQLNMNPLNSSTTTFTTKQSHRSRYWHWNYGLWVYPRTWIKLKLYRSFPALFSPMSELANWTLKNLVTVQVSPVIAFSEKPVPMKLSEANVEKWWEQIN